MLCKMPRPNEEFSPSYGTSTTVLPSFTIPPHVLGRTVHNPTIDSTGPGRRLQKPRPGMRVPYRNLTSQIVTQDEIAQEILKRQMKRNSVTQPTVLLDTVLVDNVRNRGLHFGGSGDTTFAKSLSQKLANQLSSQAEVEEKGANGVTGSNGVLWPQVQVETSEQNQYVSSHGCYSIKDKQLDEVIHGDSNGIDVAIIPHKNPSISPRINHHKTSKLDKEAEKEMALKQLKELPMIKDSESAVRRKNLLKSDTNMKHSLSINTPAELKNCNKVELKDSSGGDEKLVVNTSSDNSSDIGQTLPSTQDCRNVHLKNSEAKSVHPPVSSGKDEGKGNEMLSKHKEPNKCFLRKTKWKSKRIFKSNLSNGHCKKLKGMGLKRRSTRLSDKDALTPVKNMSSQEVPHSSSSGMKNRKRGRPKILRESHGQPTNSCSISPSTDFKENNTVTVESSSKRARISDSNSDDRKMCETPANHHSLLTAVDVKIEPGCALKTAVDQNSRQSQVEMKETKMNKDKLSSKPSSKKNRRRYLTEVEKLLKDEGAATMMLETCSLNEEGKFFKPVLSEHRKVVKHASELERLVKDEGVAKMLMETNPLVQQMMVKNKFVRSQTIDLRRTVKQRIFYKSKLANKNLLINSSLPSRLRTKTMFKRNKDIVRKRKLAEKKRQLFAKKSESNLSQLERRAGADSRKAKDETKGESIEEKTGTAAEVTDISKSPPKRERDSSMSIDVSVQRVALPLTAKASRIIRRHSSSSSFSSRSSSPVGMNCRGRRGSSSSNLTKDMSYALRDGNAQGYPSVALEILSEGCMKGIVDSSRISCVSRCSSSRKLVAVPRMSAAVRLKLNTEMSKNFQKGLNVESAKNISAKTSTSPKAKRSLVSSEQSLKQNSVYDLKFQSPNPATSVNITQPLNDVSKVKILSSIDVIHSTQSPSNPSQPVVPSNSLSSVVQSVPTVKGLEIINEGELAVCVKKLQERKDVSITAVNDCGESTVEFSNNIPAARSLLPTMSSKTSAPSVVPRQAASSSGVVVEVVPKLKKFKNPKDPFLKTIMGKEHRIVGLPLSPVASYKSVMKSLENVAQKHKKRANSKIEKPLDSNRQRSSGRQNAGTYNYKEISLRRYENFVQVILTPGSTKMKNSLNVQVLHEFRDALQQLRRDEFCRVVLVTSTGSTFCQGVDLHSLLHTNIERRKKAALELSEALKEFLRVLAMFNKPIVAGVHGAAVGLGVTMLPFFDVVYASDKATFHAPYARLGQIPEGAAVLTLPLMLGNAVTSELLFGSRKLTASEALQYGLVTRVFWPDTFQEELIPNIRSMANQSSQSMQAMKALLRLNLRVKLEATLDSESSLLVQHWCSPECQRNFRRFLETSDEVFLQRQKKDPC